MEPVVSIICNTYNHEKFIKTALDGFLAQRCSFPFEVLIHDDASTDGTADIIRDYARLYPQTVIPMLREENAYSKGISITPTYQIPRVRGKYTAFCEGDDYWTDPLKLQRQVDALEECPQVDICTHSATVTRDGVLTGEISPDTKKRIFTPAEVILGGGDFVATSSLLYRSDIDRNMPQFRKYLHLDYTMQIHGSLRGGMLYLPETMSEYRVFNEGSWSSLQNTNTERMRSFHEKYKKMLTLLDSDTDGRFREQIEKKEREAEFYYLGREYRFREMLAPEFSLVRRELSLKNRVLLRGKAMFPDLVRLVREKKHSRRNGGDGHE